MTKASQIQYFRKLQKVENIHKTSEEKHTLQPIMSVCLHFCHFHPLGPRNSGWALILGPRAWVYYHCATANGQPRHFLSFSKKKFHRTCLPRCQKCLKFNSPDTLKKSKLFTNLVRKNLRLNLWLAIAGASNIRWAIILDLGMVRWDFTIVLLLIDNQGMAYKVKSLIELASSDDKNISNSIVQNLSKVKNIHKTS